MKLTFLGTGAADWDFSKRDETPGFRRFSSALVNGELLIDPGPHVFDAFEKFDIAPGSIKYIINTHPHSDHFNLDTLHSLEALGAKFIELESGEEKSVGDYKISTDAGNHATVDRVVHFIIDDGEKKLFYGLDGAWLLYEEYRAIKEHRPDLAVLDATIGFVDGDFRIFEHNDLNMVLEMKKTLSPYVKSFCISHMAMTLHTNHETLAKKMSEYGVITAYDGLTLEF